ncbi:MAG: ubiquinone/menaquinone biosynthesis methyltransferase [Candidatus Omnitrophota bacterium]|jgi:demethylmenaquinone methyltransferase/2-methoxy-6-polyprenyl-1,4-benzoquinol methylase
MAILESAKIRKLFDRIAVRYDFLNSLLSFRLDLSWRNRASIEVAGTGARRILDLGTGTGKFLEPFLKRRAWDLSAGMDFSGAMLQVAQKRMDGEVRWIQGDFGAMPFKAASFDLIVSAFTLRSVADLGVFFRAVYGLLDRGGKAAFLCLTRPVDRWVRLLYEPYMKIYLPAAGKLFSRDEDAYRFLSDSVLRFQEPYETLAMMRTAGFQKTGQKSFSGGLATLLIGEKA